MEKLKNLIRSHYELITYVIFGALTTLVNLVVFQAFNAVLGKEQYLISNFIAWVAAVIFAYFTNKIWVFKSRDWHAGVLVREILSFTAARVFSFFLEEAGLFVFVDLLRFHALQLDLAVLTVSGEMIAKLILAVVVVILNYVFSKLFIFKKAKD